MNAPPADATEPRMDPSAKDTIERLALQPHPEGGYYREIYRSRSLVQPEDDRVQRSAVTAIYYLLAAGQHSGWHRVRSDEIWQFCEGDGLDLFLASPALDLVEHVRLGPLDQSAEPVRTVPAGWWQAARPTGRFALVVCTVAPGFEFVDFSMLRGDDVARQSLERLDPLLLELL